MSINLMELGNNVQEIRADAMATDATPPPPPGDYRIHLVPAEKVKFPEKHPKHPGKEAFIMDQQGNLSHNEKGFITYFYLKADVAQKNPMLQLVLQPTIMLADPAGGDPKPYPLEKLWASVMVMQGVKTSMVDTLLRSIKGVAGVGLEDFKKVGMLYMLVTAGQAIAHATCDWECRHTDAEVESDKDGNEIGREYPLAKYEGKRLSTAANFPKDAQGNLIPLDIDPTDGSPARTRLVVKKWKPAPVQA